ncbi:uncharacterized protein NEPG_02220 [Nematocida parisii ERTm1]|uniref:Uncharacterized protein n=1 Tax=Nematocida parisii (strain ERTm3) TaxID=935791 RepID=I3EEE7_NEMP3|nr:uncharacterized protein NEPG_02220 [Nematocida parisii ERTm1]EIJ87594.1 hypothetical protein NEQG_02141 [Nematocida parisii ERTm3]EIJ92821.1 hypothetical protein NEPG_02220 [Nematocida parisii ERTm1]|eukprot:XP_013060047.1 hypothetical protein NEPG_02220 [Nematocida parisii ERTm1]
MPTSYTEFQAGGFLNNPQFLIQAYIYEYITKADDIEKFVSIVHDMLCSLIKRKEQEQEQKKQSLKDEITCLYYILDKYFIPNEENNLTYIGVDCAALYIRLKQNISAYEGGIIDVRTLAIKKEEEFIKKYYTEAVLLKVFSLLIYESYQKQKNFKQKLAILPEPIVNFFEKHSEEDLQIPSEPILDDWKELIINQLNFKEIGVGKGDLTILPGLISMIQTILCIMGKFKRLAQIDTIEKKINESGIDNPISCDLVKSLEDVSYDIFKRACPHIEFINVELIHPKKGHASQKKIDVYGYLKLKYFAYKIKKSILINIKNPSDTRLPENDIPSLPNNGIPLGAHNGFLNELEKVFENLKNTLAEHMLRSYIESAIQTTSEKKIVQTFINSAELNSKNSLNAGILCFMTTRQLQNSCYRTDLMIFLIYYAFCYNLPKNNCIVRFAENLLQSTKFAPNANSKVLCFLIMIGKASKSYFNNVELSIPECQIKECFSDVVDQILIYASKSVKAEKGIYALLRGYLILDKKYNVGYIRTMLSTVAKEEQVDFFNTLTKNRTTFYYIDEITSLIMKQRDKSNNDEIETSVKEFFHSIIRISSHCKDRSLILDLFIEKIKEKIGSNNMSYFFDIDRTE